MSKNKSDLINVIAGTVDLSKAKAAEVWAAIEHMIYDTVASGREISLAGFGKFTRRKLAARTIKNPRTGELIHVQSSWVPSFRPGKNFKEHVAGAVDASGAMEETVGADLETVEG